MHPTLDAPLDLHAGSWRIHCAQRKQCHRPEQIDRSEGTDTNRMMRRNTYVYFPATLKRMSKQYPNPPTMAIDPNKKYTATLTTSRGEIVCELFAKEAPKTVNNFVFLARDKFYDGTVFHRVINDFMVQGGDPTGTGRGGPGYRFEDEFKGNPHKHQIGTLSMANAGPGT